MIRAAEPADWPAIWAILEPVFRAGETYAVDPMIGEVAARDYWLSSPAGCYVACESEDVVGTFYIRTNAQGGGAHVCNCGYMTASSAQGQGLAARMCEWSQGEARRLGYRAMQFNMVLASNTHAVRLWHKLGFETVGQLPKVFDHPHLGLVDAHVMYKWLEAAS